ncbi:hypothetical protein QP248_09610 [Aerococcus sp. UMB8608]|uniref:hypothetical protein n=1 Tax=Aerococcus sp. UMB8608 TaxID=3046347 RepID=UPI00254F0034|nr:hypothetical protein [Aerococcus sp. UMB8608]MDK6680689.1 hypothetical protein [Aerococcus sp. UMB8608]
MQRQLKQDILKILACSASLCFFLSQEVQAAPVETPTDVEAKESQPEAPGLAEPSTERAATVESPAAEKTSEKIAESPAATSAPRSSLEKKAESESKAQEASPRAEAGQTRLAQDTPKASGESKASAPKTSKESSSSTSQKDKAASSSAPKPASKLRQAYKPVISRSHYSPLIDPSSTPTDQLPLPFQALIKKGLPNDKLINYPYGWTTYNKGKNHTFPANLASEQRLANLTPPSEWLRKIELSADQKQLLVSYSNPNFQQDHKWIVSYEVNDQPQDPEKASSLIFHYHLDRQLERIVDHSQDQGQADLPPYQKFSQEGLSGQEAEKQVVTYWDLMGLPRESWDRYFSFPLRTLSKSPKGQHQIIPEKSNSDNHYRFTILGPLPSANDRDLLYGIQNWTPNPQDFGKLRVWRRIDKETVQEPLSPRPGILEDDRYYFIVEDKENPFSEFIYQDLPHSPEGASDEELLSFDPYWLGVNWKQIENSWDPILNLPFKKLTYHKIDNQGRLTNQISWSKFVIPREDKNQVDLIYQYSDRPMLDTKTFKAHWRVSKEALADQKMRYHYRQLLHFTEEWAQKKPQLALQPKVLSDLDLILTKDTDDPAHYYAKETQREKIDDKTELIHLTHYRYGDKLVGKLYVPRVTFRKEVWRKEILSEDETSYQVKFSLVSSDPESNSEGLEKVFSLPKSDQASEARPFFTQAEKIRSQEEGEGPVDIPNLFNILPTSTVFEGPYVYPVLFADNFYVFKSPSRPSGFEAFYYQTEPVEGTSDYILTLTNISGADNPYNRSQRRYRVQQYGLESPVPFFSYTMKFYTDLDHPDRVYRYIGDDFGQGGQGTGGRQVLTKEKPYEGKQVKLPDKDQTPDPLKEAGAEAGMGTDGRDGITEDKPYEEGLVNLPDQAPTSQAPNGRGPGQGSGQKETKDPEKTDQASRPDQPNSAAQLGQGVTSQGKQPSKPDTQSESWLDRLSQSLKDWINQPSQRIVRRQTQLPKQDDRPEAGGLAQLIQNFQDRFLRPNPSQEADTAQALAPEDRPLRTRQGLNFKEAIAQIFQTPVQAAEEEGRIEANRQGDQGQKGLAKAPSAETKQASETIQSSKENEEKKTSKWPFAGLLALLLLPLAYWLKKRQ